MAESPCLRRDNQVRLVEQILAGRRVVVGRDRHGRGRGIHGAGKHVLVELVVVAVAETIPECDSRAEPVLEERREEIDGRIRRALRRVTEERAGSRFHGTPVERRDAAVCDPFIVEVLVAGAERRVWSNPECDGGIEAVALDADAMAVGVGVLVQRGGAKGNRFVESAANVCGESLVVPRSELQRGFTRLSPVGLPRHAVDHAADAAAAEDHRVRPLECFHAIDVVDIAEVLHVIANAIDEEIRRRAVASQDRRVPIAFTLGEANARHVPGHVRHAGHALIGDQGTRDDADGLGNISQRCRRLRRRRNGRNRVADRGARR